MSECCKKTVRCDDVKKSLSNRVNRIEGQISGIKNMIEDDRYCIDILNQIEAVRAALGSLESVILCNHINNCVADGIKHNDSQIVSELAKTVEKFIKKG
ncbi:MAG: metal-sensing transcriptional repressor [Clostridia bacterium]|nr:metal-sensing transcriptional repressor [Clostridia bacterium]